MRETCAESASLSRLDTQGPVVRKGQDAWGRIRVQELSAGKKYATHANIWLPMAIHGYTWQ